MEKRGKSLSFFDINQEKAPTLSQITLRLTDENGDSNHTSKVVDWVADGIKAQNDQLVCGFFSCPFYFPFLIDVVDLGFDLKSESYLRSLPTNRG
jgi:hypothetical protein